MPKSIQARRLGVFGGSFNPVHTGHLLLARQALEALRLDAVWLLPCAASADAKRLAPGSLRLRWLRKALRGEPGLRACDWDLKRGGVTRSIDTLRELRERLPGTRLTLLLGQDQWERFDTWKDWKAIPRLAGLAVWPRGQTALRGRRGIRIRTLPASQLSISSTEIRARIRKGYRVSLLLPPGLAQDAGLKRQFQSSRKLSTSNEYYDKIIL